MKTHCLRGHPFFGPEADVRLAPYAARGNRKAGVQRVCRVCDRQRVSPSKLRRVAEISAGRRYIDETAIEAVMIGHVMPLTIHERRVAIERFLAQDVSVKQTAANLRISARTVERHVQRMKERDV